MFVIINVIKDFMQPPKMWITFFLLLLLLTGGFLRFYNLDGQSYWIDEGYSINGVLSVLEKGVPILDSGRWYHDEVYAYPTALTVKIFGNNAFAYRFWPAVFGCLFIFVIFFFVRDLFGIWPALLSSFFITFSYWQIAWSRQARRYTLWEVFFWLALWCFWRWNQYNNHKWLIGTTIFTILAIATHKLSILLLVIYFIWLVILLCKKGKISWKWLVASFFFLLSVVMVDYQLFNAIIGGLNKINFGIYINYYLNWVIRNYWLFLIVIGVGMARGNFLKVNNIKKIFFVGLPFIVYFLTLSFLFDESHIYYRYLFNVFPSLIILGSLGLTVIASEVKQFKKNYGLNNSWQLFVLIIVIGLFFISGQGVLWHQNFYFLEHDDVTKPMESWRKYYFHTPQPDFNGAYKYIKGNKQKDNIVIAAFPVFNKIFLNEPGYWIKFHQNYFGDANVFKNKDRDTEYYVNAKVIDNLKELIKITNKNHGFIVLDFVSTNERISGNILNYIANNFKMVFSKETKPWIKIWVFKF